MDKRGFFSLLALAQGAYYLLTGLWSLVSPRTFQAITGPKRDYWLVRTVGVLVSVIGAVLAVAGLRRQSTREVPLLAIGSAAGLATIDTVYAAQGRISKVYLLDALVEGLLVAAWAFVRRRGRRVPLILELFRTHDETEQPADAPRAVTHPAPAAEALGV